MNKNLLDLLKDSEIVTSLLEEKGGHFCVDDIVGVSLLFASAFTKNKNNYLIVTNSLYNAQKISNFIASLIGYENVILFPNDEMIKSDYLSSSKELLAQRLYALYQLSEAKKHVIITHTSALLMPLPKTEEFISNIINLKVGMSVDLNDLKKKLVLSGYLKVNKIDQSLEFASRGDILDIYSINYDNPVRIEFFGDEIESIRFFSISEQISTIEINEINIIPASDYLYSDEEIENFKIRCDSQMLKDIKMLNGDKVDIFKENIALDIEKIEGRIYFPKIYKYFLYLKNSVGSLLDYIDTNFVFIDNEKQFYASEQLLLKETHEYLNDLFSDGKILSHQEMYLTSDKIFKGKKLISSSPIASSHNDLIFNIRPLVFSKNNLTNINLILKSYFQSDNKIAICLSNKQQFDTVLKILDDEKIEYEIVSNLEVPSGKIAISNFHLDEGFELPNYNLCFISSKELFGYHSHSSKFFNKYKESTIINSYEDLKPGDYVVHENYGIGQFVDIITDQTNGIYTDYLHIQYAGSDALYVPLSQFRLIRKYFAREGAKPKLSSMSSSSWEKTKKKIKSRINDLADRLFKLYSERNEIEGFEFVKDDELQEAFEAEFPYELTNDQEKSLSEIKKDMMSNKAMDRLLCGDVGFGKTEVALRAIFKAILSNKQAAILCPTTLLARQHYETALERFSNFGVKIAVLSRLVPMKTQNEYIKKIATGEIDLVIGTHRLLSKEIKFHNLGLLVIDEEQRFGVEQKEKIKELKSNLDVLSLSATPIPRTLQLSLIGVRPVSQIETAPTNRNSIQTYVVPYRFEIAKELIERELSRQGQVFYIYNRVDGIFQKANSISRAIPTANIGVVHGKMDKDEIDDVMSKFYLGEINVLVATSIIENGIDVPNANLMIVEDADRFGLAQLYQIKGRVGRGSRIAYAYLFYKESKELSDVATKRLKAIQDFAELGSGYKIAQRDLMIRGAGDILGSEQAGFIDSIGLDLYLKLLNESLEERKTGIEHEPPKRMKLFEINAYIPENYAAKEDKIQLYQEIDEAKNEKELNAVKKKFRDIYGRLPKEVSLLFKRKEIDILLLEEEFEDVLDYSNRVEVVLTKKFSSINGIGIELFDNLQEYIGKIKMSYINKILKLILNKENDWFEDLLVIVNTIHSTYKKHKIIE